MGTKIEWTGETWNPITGCTEISEGCRYCYAKRMASRLKGRFGYPERQPFRPGVFHGEQFHKPFSWKNPRSIFVCSMGDLFHEDVKLDDIVRVFSVMGDLPQHTFQVLTKRPERMLIIASKIGWPDNVWAGVTVENSYPTVTERLLFLAKVPAPVKFVSVEPMIGGITLGIHKYWLDWVICGAETGQKARPCNIEWVRNLKYECQETGIPFFFKKFADGNREIDGQVWQQTPANKRLQKTPGDGV